MHAINDEASMIYLYMGMKHLLTYLAILFLQIELTFKDQIPKYEVLILLIPQEYDKFESISSTRINSSLK